jgi:glutathione S-transferase
MIKIFGHPASTCTRKVLFTLHETNTPYELVVVDFAKGEHKQEPHLSRQPFGKVPALDDDGFALYESRAMARYIDGKSGGALTPTDLKQRAEMEKWISIETENFSGHAMKFVAQHIFKREQTPEALENATKGLALACSVLDKNLANKTFLVGDKLTIADVTYTPYFEYAMATPAKEIFAKYPHVVAWWNRISERPAWRKAAGR